MRHIKKNLLVLFSVLLMLGCISLPAHASAPASETIYFEDGSYLVLELTTSSTLARASTVSGSKNGAYYNNEGDLAWTVTVHGTFTYDGKSATATSATYSYQIYNSNWSLKSGSAYCSGNQAVAQCSFSTRLLLNRSTTVALSCSPTGVLS